MQSDSVLYPLLSYFLIDKYSALATLTWAFIHCTKWCRRVYMDPRTS